MDLGAFIKSLEHKIILLTGSTGFLSKVFLEKILRIQPRVKKIFLLIRAEGSVSANQRLHKDVMEKELFMVLREEHGEGFDEFISDKISAVAGDISLENLGVKDYTLMDKLYEEINYIVNVAASTSFDERYDVALCTNAMGAKHVGEFARKCKTLDLLVHVSTAFVTREKQGLVLEKAFQMGETDNESSSLDIAAEFKLAQETLQELRQKKLTDKDIRISMKMLGMQRAKLHGWLNTYVFTKAIGEMLVGFASEHVPLVIVRPTIVTSTYKEPFPGWSEGFRNIDPMIDSYGKGQLKHFLVDNEGIMDAIPADMVVNAMIAIMAAHHCRQPVEAIYHVCSSLPNPLRWSKLPDWGYQYFSKNPLIGENGKPLKVSGASLVPNLASFRKLLILRFTLPLMVLLIINTLCFNIFGKQYYNLNRTYKMSIRLGELYFRITQFKGRFDDSNLERLRASMKKNDDEVTKAFFLDPKCIDWENYFMNIHFFGVTKYVLT